MTAPRTDRARLAALETLLPNLTRIEDVTREIRRAWQMDGSIARDRALDLLLGRIAQLRKEQGHE